MQSTLGNFLHGSTTPEWLRDGVRCVLHAVKGRSEPMHQLVQLESSFALLKVRSDITVPSIP